MPWQKKVSDILMRGISLSSVGVNNWALDRDQAILTIDRLESLNIPILGGDVYEIVDDRMESNYDSWHCDRNPEEGIDEFVERSAGCARKYISNYNNPRGRKTYFVLVAD